MTEDEILAELAALLDEFDHVMTFKSGARQGMLELLNERLTHTIRLLRQCESDDH